MDVEVAVSVSNVNKTYKLYQNPSDRIKEALSPFRRSYHHDFLALANININITKGESVGIVGRNGSGKSTLLKIRILKLTMLLL